MKSLTARAHSFASRFTLAPQNLRLPHDSSDVIRHGLNLTAKGESMKRTILALTLTLMLSSVASAAVEDDGGFFTPVNAAATSASTSSAGTDEEGLKNPSNNITGKEANTLPIYLTLGIVLRLMNFGL
jgi:hypothetical protein